MRAVHFVWILIFYIITYGVAKKVRMLAPKVPDVATTVPTGYPAAMPTIEPTIIPSVLPSNPTLAPSTGFPSQTPTVPTSSQDIITTIAGTGSSSYSGDNGAATSATLNSPFGVALDASGRIL